MVAIKTWTQEQIRILTELYPNHTSEYIGTMVGHSTLSVRAKAFMLGLKKEKEWMKSMAMKTAFKKGHIPPNKGKKWDEYISKEKQEKSRKTTFKKGHVSHNKKPVGYEMKGRDGYWFVKVAEPDVFKMKHRVLWEKHNGPIPKGTRIMFIDGNPDNITLENLTAITRADAFNKYCSIHTTLPPELREFIQLKGALKRQINKIENKNGTKRKHRTAQADEEQALGVQE